MHAMENGGGRTMASNGGVAVEGSTSTKARLNDILESFHAFDSDMKTGTRVRRENDEHRIAQLTAELTRLEKTLNQEIKRRIEMNKSVQVVRHWRLRSLISLCGQVRLLKAWKTAVLVLWRPYINTASFDSP